MRERAYRFQLHFNAVHNIEPELPEKMHGHTFRIIVCAQGESEDMTVYNECETQVRNYLTRFQGTRLNHMPQFKNKIPSIEVMCEVFFKELDEILAKNQVNLLKVEIGDNPLSTYSLSKKLMVGSVYRTIKDEDYEAYLKEITKE